jgi:hypothetical protein
MFDFRPSAAIRGASSATELLCHHSGMWQANGRGFEVSDSICDRQRSRRFQPLSQATEEEGQKLNSINSRIAFA